MCTRVFGATIIATILLAGASTVRADLPADRTVYIYMYDVPNDPDSDIVFAVELNLEAVEMDGNWVAWEITSATFRKPGTPETVWTDNAPGVDSPDGLWWVEHADPQDPQHSEFVMPPLVDGVATAEEPPNDDLEYTVEGVSYDPPPGGAPFDATGALNYAFILLAQQIPIELGDEEPVDVAEGGHEAQ